MKCNECKHECNCALSSKFSYLPQAQLNKMHDDIFISKTLLTQLKEKAKVNKTKSCSFSKHEGKTSW